mmetsp:Transcript_38638/g.28506  ORF Transcript_38638/g.28506 Transcript_38638/m.28506 type:complete len:94 (-) Transcript_38638:983-1264(-)
MMDHNQSTLNSKLSKAVDELGKVVSENNNEQVSNIAGQSFTYADIKKICEKIMNNRELATSILFNSMLPMISTIPSMMPTAQMNREMATHSQD